MNVDKGVGQIRKVIQDLITPDMKEVKAGLAYLKEELPRMEQRIIQQTTDRIKATEDRLLLTFQLAQATARIEELEGRLKKSESGEAH